jgi:metal-responsive CopG/Arc/MetJ family transcriptional regulator
MENVRPPKKKRLPIQINIRLSPTIKQEMDAIADRKYTTVSSLVREALLNFIEHDAAVEKAKREGMGNPVTAYTLPSGSSHVTYS